MKNLLKVFMISAAIASPIYAAASESESFSGIDQSIVTAHLNSTPSLDATIPSELRVVPSLKKDTGTYETQNSLGTGVFRLFNINGVHHVILGKRFGQMLKCSIGGAVDPEDKTLQDAITRELSEEYFAQLPLSSNLELISTEPHQAGGITAVGGEIKTAGWGPYFAFGAIDSGYTLEDIQASLEIMNANASIHTKLANFFGFNFEKMTAEEKQKGAQEMLDLFAQSTFSGFVDMSGEAKAALNAISENGEHDLGEKAFDFAKKHVHTYSEYSTFQLMTYDAFNALAENDITESAKSKDYKRVTFWEDAARQHFNAILKDAAGPQKKSLELAN